MYAPFKIRVMERLIQQQARIITLLEKIAPKEEVTASSDERRVPAEKLPEHVRIRRLKLYRAALNGDWEVAKRIYDNCEEDIAVKISYRGETALHIASGAKQIDFVKKLVRKMNENDLRETNEIGSTALFFAAASGVVELAEEMMKNNKEIAMDRDKCRTLPIEMAASLGHKDMVEYLYKETRHSLEVEDRNELFVASIETDLYDVALQLLEDYPDLATARVHARAGDNQIGVTALHVLAYKHPTFSDLDNQNQRRIFERCFNRGAKDVENKKRLQLVKRIWRRVILLSHSEILDLIAKPENLIFDAAERGNFDFLSILIGEYPDLIYKCDNKDNNYTIFHVAVKNRQVDVFKLIYEMGAIKDLIVKLEDKEGNNILHLAAMVAPQARLNIVSGAALQMQRELLWFKGVKNLVQPKYAQSRNKNGFTPRALFTEKHESLRDKGEKWMKDTATSCMLVATLIATVVFTAAFTVPGGNNEDTGFPFFLGKVSFKIFAISDAISLVSSSASIINFLSILTSQFAEEHFLLLLPRKLLIGLVTLFISMAAMMVVFSTTFFIVFNDGRLLIAILVTVITSTLIIMFICQHFQLLCDVFRSTYVSNSLFQPRKNSIFREEREASDQRSKSKILNAHLKIQCRCSTNV